MRLSSSRVLHLGSLKCSVTMHLTRSLIHTSHPSMSGEVATEASHRLTNAWSSSSPCRYSAKSMNHWK
ncbi:hypothetical protein PC129_g7162 [Phytophthora cactorum]|uniref:Uncharacterized protein n=1 Tax=Phytophthora cactorum TaxID=29920 RepID=A0A8T0Z8K2_9STRA|nr:hypothetical protein PC112_g8961 [Phytophthora cactorum]KAG2858841.1 hypothetical protein PC113_g9463 [Phytophthora cactorum]KAG2923549.1 hypothetical protein PC114_g4788 [Phytophthora cactorum]KAG3171765.1 hypothetical protein C6341_g10407 [Phytophthora cactorum]KAG3185623.1 hypothetical protein PC128_g13278 [Phytophthora cactorum]